MTAKAEDTIVQIKDAAGAWTDYARTTRDAALAAVAVGHLPSGNLQEPLRAVDWITKEEIAVTTETTAPKATTRKPTKYEDAGVPAEYLSPNGRFKVGWDAKFKSVLISTVLDESVAEGKRAAAEAMLAKLEWTAHLEKSRASRQRKANVAAAKAKAAEQAQADERSSPETTDSVAHAANPDGTVESQQAPPPKPRAGKRARMPKATSPAA